MSIILADIDATCASLGYYDGKTYVPEPTALHELKVNIIVDFRQKLKHNFLFRITNVNVSLLLKLYF